MARIKKMRAEIVITHNGGKSSVTLSTRKDTEITYDDLQRFLDLAQEQLKIARGGAAAK